MSEDALIFRTLLSEVMGLSSLQSLSSFWLLYFLANHIKKWLTQIFSHIINYVQKAGEQTIFHRNLLKTFCQIAKTAVLLLGSRLIFYQSENFSESKKYYKKNFWGNIMTDLAINEQKNLFYLLLLHTHLCWFCSVFWLNISICILQQTSSEYTSTSSLHPSQPIFWTFQ